jgi:hypothetical protein
MTTRVIYVISSSRSGSTALDLSLGRYRGVRSAGELNNLFGFGLRDGGLCGCGHAVAVCPFWCEVRDRGGEVLQKAWREPGSQAEAQAMVRRLRHTPDLLQARRPRVPPTVLRAHQSVGRALIEAVGVVAEGDVIVDSSKLPSGAAELLHDDRVDPYFVHLVRDPRAVAYSVSQPRVQEGASDRRLMSRSHVSRAAVLWSVTNSLAESVRRRAGAGRFVRVRYEDLCDAPEEVIGSILTGAVTAGVLASVPVEAPEAENHTAWGNPMRLQAGPVTWRRDRRWQVEMPRRQRALAFGAAAPLALRYGYRPLNGGER